MSEQQKIFMARLHEEYRRMTEQAASLQELVKEPIDQPFQLNLWDLSAAELDQEMANRLSALNDDINTRPSEKITSHRRVIGPLIVMVKNVLRKLLSPYTNLVLARQVKFNEDMVAFHLATFIRFRQLDNQLTSVGERLNAIKDEQADHD